MGLRGPYRQIDDGVQGRKFRNDQNANFDDIWSDVQQAGTGVQAIVNNLNVQPGSGDGNAEVVAARTNADGQTFGNLKDRLFDLDSYFQQLFFIFVNDLDAGLFTDAVTGDPIDGGVW